MKKEFRKQMTDIIANASNMDIQCIETIIEREKVKRTPPKPQPLYGKCDECREIGFLFKGSWKLDDNHYCEKCLPDNK